MSDPNGFDLPDPTENDLFGGDVDDGGEIVTTTTAEPTNSTASRAGRRRRWVSIGLDDPQYEDADDVDEDQLDLSSVDNAATSSTGYWRKWEDSSLHEQDNKKQRIDHLDILDLQQLDNNDKVDADNVLTSHFDPLNAIQEPEDDEFDLTINNTKCSLNSILMINNNNNNNIKNQKMPHLDKVTVTGLRQSPINIDPSNSLRKRSIAESDQCIPPLTIDYSAITGASGLTLENTGNGWKLNIPDEVAQQCAITGGPLGTDQYRLLQIHCHWGKDSSCGSEHTVNGSAFPCEIHMVHWNATKYDNPLEAMECTSDGLSVVGVFVQFSEDHSSKPLDVILDSLPQIQFRGDEVPLTDTMELDLNEFVPSRDAPKYWTYPGSLTTPPFCESVIWIVMEQPIVAQEIQIAQFREMNQNDYSAEDIVPLEKNFREVQALNNRNVSYFD